MFARLTHAGIAFAVTVAVYQGYVLALAPFVEPADAVAAVVQPIPLNQIRDAPAALERYRPLLETYFPAAHWCFGAPPIIVENNQALLVLDTAQRYTQSPSGELRVPRLAIIFFPTPRERAGEPPRDAIILEPAGGATLQMDQQLGQGHGLGAMGRMQYGQFLGAVTVRSDMKQPGSLDDLLIETRDLYMNEDLIRTPEAVTFRLGAHRGHGRGLEIRFFKTESSASDVPATMFGKLDSLEVSREVAAEIAPGESTLFGAQRSSDANPVGGQSAKFADAPARITCTGAFNIDFANYVATFAENVLVRQLHDGGALDELRCHELTMYFDPKRPWGGEESTPADPAAASYSSVRLEPAMLEANGLPDAPMQLEASSQGASARGGRLRLDLVQRQVTLDGGDEVSVHYRGAEIRAPMVQYELPPKDSSRRLGLIAARGGQGVLHAAPDPARPAERLEVRWTQSMQMIRRQGQSVLVLDGRPRVSMVDVGTLWADQLELYLSESESAGAVVRVPAGYTGAAGRTTISAERVVATGSVGIESAELNGKVNQLDLRILNAAAAPAANPSGARPAASASNVTTPATPAMFDRQRGAAPRRSYFIAGRTLEIDAVVRDRRPQMTALRVDGGVDFRETTPGATGEAPMRILAEHLNVSDVDAEDAKIEIRGGDATGSLPAGLAEISARGTVLRAPTLAINRGTSQAWINSPGEVQMLMTRDMRGRPLATPQQLRMTWRDSMRLDRDRITFLGNVFVEHADGWLRTRRLVAVLTAPVAFDGASSGKPPELAQLECWEGTLAEFDQRDDAGAVTAHQHVEVESLAINQITGALRGEGPGLVDSVHFSRGDGAWDVAPKSVGVDMTYPTPQQQDIDSGPPRLKHLRIKFHGGVGGNIHTPEVSVHGDVRTVYGPIDSWDQRLEMTASGSPGRDEIWITCDSMYVTDSPLARLQAPAADGKRPAFGLIDLKAEGNVVIEGQHVKHGAFTLRGDRATYDQAKTMFVLQSVGPNLATITLQKFRGGPIEPQSAKTFIYWQNTGAFIVDGFSKFGYTMFNDP